MSALHVSAQRGQEDMRGFAGCAQIEMHKFLPSILLSSCWRRLVGRTHKPPDLKPAAAGRLAIARSLAAAMAPGRGGKRKGVKK